MVNKFKFDIYITVPNRIDYLSYLTVLLSSRALRRADHAAAAGFSDTPPPPKFATGAPNAAAADNL